MMTLLRCATDELRLVPDGGAGLVVHVPTSMCRLATGRSALLHMIQRLQQEDVRTVLLPAYVAEGVIRPFRVAGFEIEFYRLRPDLSPDAEHVERLLTQAGRRAVFIRIHYFGFPVACADLDAMLERHASIVVDDLAHAPFATVSSGSRLVEHAQVALFSLNKFLPVTDGAILVSNREDIDVTTDESSLAELPPEVLRAYESHLEAGRELSETTDPVKATAALARLAAEYEEYYACINSDLTPHRQSARSRRIEAAFPLRKLVAGRQRNSRILYAGLKNVAFSLVHPTLDANVVPFCIPARVTQGQRDSIRARLFEKGIVLSTLQEKWDFIPPARRADFRVESAFLENHVLIPVGEAITESGMGELVEGLNEI